MGDDLGVGVFRKGQREEGEKKAVIRCSVSLEGQRKNLLDPGGNLSGRAKEEKN